MSTNQSKRPEPNQRPKSGFWKTARQKGKKLLKKVQKLLITTSEKAKPLLTKLGVALKRLFVIGKQWLSRLYDLVKQLMKKAKVGFLAFCRWLQNSVKKLPQKGKVLTKKTQRLLKTTSEEMKPLLTKLGVFFKKLLYRGKQWLNRLYGLTKQLMKKLKVGFLVLWQWLRDNIEKLQQRIQGKRTQMKQQKAADREIAAAQQEPQEPDDSATEKREENSRNKVQRLLNTVLKRIKALLVIVGVFLKKLFDKSKQLLSRLSRLAKQLMQKSKVGFLAFCRWIQRFVKELPQKGKKLTEKMHRLLSAGLEKAKPLLAKLGVILKKLVGICKQWLSRIYHLVKLLLKKLKVGFLAFWQWLRDYVKKRRQSRKEKKEQIKQQKETERTAALSAPNVEDKPTRKTRKSGIGKNGTESTAENVQEVKTRKQRKQLDKQKKKKRKRSRRRVFPIWLRLIVIPALAVIAIIAGAVVGYGIIGERNPLEVFQKDTWQHLIDLVMK